MKGRACLVTGASAGIGKATAAALAGMGAKVVMVCHNRERGTAAREEIRRATGNRSVTLLLADLSSQGEIRRLAAQVRRKHRRLHVLVNNAGIFRWRRSVTVDGLETTFAVNHLAPFLLTNLLLPCLRAGAPSRVVTVSSEARKMGRIRFEDLQRERFYRPFPAYAQSKLGNVLFTIELARRLRGTRVTANCVHPGAVATSLFPLGMSLGRFVLRTPGQGADTSVWLASSPEASGVTGKYFTSRMEIVLRDRKKLAAVARRLWKASESLTGGL